MLLLGGLVFTVPDVMMLTPMFHDNKALLRFMTFGSVDGPQSTLTGRFLRYQEPLWRWAFQLEAGKSTE